MNIRDYIKNKKLLCDGAFGTYFSTFNAGILPEKANTAAPELVLRVHRDYIKAGANLIITNTFASNKRSLGCTDDELKANIKSAYSLAKMAAGDNVFVACDIGPESKEDFYLIADTFIECGAEIIVFETFPEVEEIIPVVKYIKSKNKDIFVLTQFCVNQHSYTEEGISATRLFDKCNQVEEIDAFGLNCGVGPSHLLDILKKINLETDKIITAFPNASYPSVVQDRMVFLDNINYFSEVMADIAHYADVIGGCCGTNPQYIKAIGETVDINVDFAHHSFKKKGIANVVGEEKHSGFFAGKEGKKLIAVELDPPKDSDCTALMETANYLKTKDVDVITFADSPSGRTRADSVLMSIKVAKEVGVNVMPHICCRDKNAIAISSLLLGAYINDVRNFLVITGDPVPSTARDNVKGVFNFDSVRLMEYMQEMNNETFASDKLCYGGAINYARRNIEIEIKRIENKIKAGAEFFLTQPVFDDKDIETLKYISSRVDTKILVGIMPLVSIRNANFIKNEITGISIPDSVINRFNSDMTKAESEAVGIEIAKEVMEKVGDFADGFYFMIPFNRLSIAKALIK